MSKEQNKKIKALKTKADKIWKQKVREKYGNLCTVCGKTAQDPHHCFPKGSFSNLRFDILNGVPLCRSCHMGIHYRSDPTILITIINKRGMDWYRALEKRSKEPSKSWKSAEYYKEIIEQLENL